MAEPNIDDGWVTINFCLVLLQLIGVQSGSSRQLAARGLRWLANAVEAGRTPDVKRCLRYLMEIEDAGIDPVDTFWDTIRKVKNA